MRALIAALAVVTPIGAPQAENAPLGIHVRVKGLPVSVVWSGGQTDVERTWIVPLRGRDNLKVEVPPVVAGDVVFDVELVSGDGVIARRTVELRVKTAGAAAPNPEMDSAQRNDAAVTPPSVSPDGLSPDLASVGPHFRIRGLPADVTLSGGSTDAERARPIPLSNGKQAWMVPLWVVDNLKIELPSGGVGNLDLVVALDNVGGALVERAIALRAKPVVVAAPRRPEPDAEQRKDAVIATPMPPPGSATAAAPSESEPDADQRKDAAIATPMPPPGSTTAAAPSGPAPDADQRKDAAIATPMPPPGSTTAAAPSGPEPDADLRKDAVIATPMPPPGSTTAAAPSGPEPGADQRKDAVIATPMPPPGSTTAAAPTEPAPDADQRREVAVATPAPATSGRTCAAGECQARTEELQQAERLVRQGDQYLAQGNIAIARQYFVRAAQMGLAMAALKMAETYDPNELARLNVYGVKPNLAEARHWYQRASDLGNSEAQARAQAQGTR